MLALPVRGCHVQREARLRGKAAQSKRQAGHQHSLLGQASLTGQPRQVVVFIAAHHRIEPLKLPARDAGRVLDQRKHGPGHQLVAVYQPFPVPRERE